MHQNHKLFYSYLLITKTFELHFKGQIRLVLELAEQRWNYSAKWYAALPLIILFHFLLIISYEKNIEEYRDETIIYNLPYNNMYRFRVMVYDQLSNKWSEFSLASVAQLDNKISKSFKKKILTWLNFSYLF